MIEQRWHVQLRRGHSQGVVTQAQYGPACARGIVRCTADEAHLPSHFPHRTKRLDSTAQLTRCLQKFTNRESKKQSMLMKMPHALLSKS